MAGRPAFKPTQKQKDAVYELAKKGFNEEQIAKRLKIAYSTFRIYKKHFSAYLEKGREDGLEITYTDVENAFYKKCLGYEYEEVKTKVISVNPLTGEKLQKPLEIERVVTTKHVPADVAAQIFFLVNRGAKRWKHIRAEEPRPDDKQTQIPIKTNIPKLDKPKEAEFTVVKESVNE